MYRWSQYYDRSPSKVCIPYICFTEYDDYAKLENRTCKSTVGSYSTMKSAMSKCQGGDLCMVVDNGCDNKGKFSLCNARDLIKSTKGTCTYVPGRFVNKILVEHSSTRKRYTRVENYAANKSSISFK